MTKLQPRPTRFELKAIVGLLLVLVATGAFAVASSAGNTGSSPRSGALHVTNNCSGDHPYTAPPVISHDHASNLNVFQAGLWVVYTSRPANRIPACWTVTS